MLYTVSEWDKGASDRALDEIARIWNNNAAGRHAFYPWTGNLLSRQLSANDKLLGKILEGRSESGELAGFAHITQVGEEGYPPAGVVEMLMVDAAHRRNGLGTLLLDKAVSLLSASIPRPGFIDALGAWPFGHAYNALADGSERSGVFLGEEGLHRLFEKAGFFPVKKSIVMRASLSGGDPRPPVAGSGFYIARRRENTWLDRVFRGRELWDHDMARADGRLLSRAIFGFMEGESRWEKRGVFSLFGVNTPHDQQGKGYAGVNISNLMAHVQDLGGAIMELHVYADNAPALALYQSLGFQPVAETMMMHKRV